MDQTFAQPPNNRGSRRWSLLLLIIVCLLLLIALVGGWAYLTFWADTAGTPAYVGVVWQRQEKDWVMTVEFTRYLLVGNREVTFNREGKGNSERHSETYRVLDAKTLKIGTQTLTIDSITSEKLVLSGGPWKFDKTEFTKQK
jgi:hypothetical protein